VVLDDINDKPRHGVEGVIRVREREIAQRDTLDVTIHAGLRAHPKEEGRDIIHFEYALLRQLCDEGDEGLLRCR